MSSIDKNQSIIDFLFTCPIVMKNKLFFNFAHIENNANQITAESDNEIASYIDGSKLKKLVTIIDTFKTVAYNPIISNYSDENVSDLKEVQSLIDWINEQGDNCNFPDFGDDIIIDEMKTSNPVPELVGVNTESTPNIVVYSITIEITYLDTSKKITKG